MKTSLIISLIIIVFFAGWFASPARRGINPNAELISDSMREWAEKTDGLTQALYEFKDFLEGGIEIKL